VKFRAIDIRLGSTYIDFRCLEERALDSIHTEIGALVRDYRKKAKMAQLDLARKLGYDNPQFVSLFERGLSKVPLNVLGQLVVILGIPERKVTEILVDAYARSVKEEILSGKKKIKLSS